MRIDELRDTLREHGEAVGAATPATRVAEVHGRIRTARRRRVTAAAGGTAAAVAAVALAVVPGSGEPDDGPVMQPTPSEFASVDGYAKDGVVFRDEVLGERLLGAAIGDRGDAVVRFSFTVPRVGLRFSTVCHGVGVDYMVRVAVDGNLVSGSSCSDEPDPDPGADGSTFATEPEEVLRDWGASPGDEISVRVTLERSKDAGGPVSGTPAVIGAGIYEDTRPQRTVAGVEVPELVEHEGRTWRLTGIFESNPGTRRLGITAEGPEHEEPHLLLAAYSGLRGPAAYEIRRDESSIDGGSLGPGTAGPSWQTVGVFEAGEPYELELVVTKGSTGRTRLSFIDYEPVD